MMLIVKMSFYDAKKKKKKKKMKAVVGKSIAGASSNKMISYANYDELTKTIKLLTEPMA